MIAEGMEDWAKAVTDGAANYCTTQMEDNATLTALRRGADAGLLDFNRVAVLRTASNFDREAPGQTPVASLAAKSGGFGPATTNAYRVGSAFADAIIDNWPAWSEGVPAE
jgi:purine nucleoside permease